MAYFNKFRGTKEFISMWERVIRFQYMITEEAEPHVRGLANWSILCHIFLLAEARPRPDAALSHDDKKSTSYSNVLENLRM